MTCRKCGKKIEGDAKVCVFCGEKAKINNQLFKNLKISNKKLVLIISLSLVFFILIIALGLGFLFRQPILASIYYSRARITENINEDKALSYAKKAVKYKPKDEYKEYISNILIRQAEEIKDEDPKLAIDLIKEAIDYYENDENKILLSNLYLIRAKKAVGRDIDEAIDIALEGIKEYNSEELRVFIENSYIEKIEKQIESEPNEAIQTLSVAKDYIREESIIPLLNKVGEAIVRKENKDANVLKIILDDLNHDKMDEVIALIHHGYDILLKIYEYKGDTYSEMNTAYIGMQDYKDLLDIRTEKLLNGPSAQIVIWSNEKNQYGYYFTEVLDYKNGNLYSVFYSPFESEFGSETEGNKSIITKEELYDIGGHVLVSTYQWDGENYVINNQEVAYEKGSFIYPSEPYNVAIAYLQAKALGLDNELKEMTYTGSTSHLYYHEDIEMNNRFSALESINGNSRYIEIDYYEEIFPSFYYYYEEEAHYVDYHINEYNENLEKCFQVNYYYDLNYHISYVLLIKDGSNWKVWAVIN
ncbi:MAG: hypothetical protein GX327_06670 [Epulopiscium sp.]|nr:hypothetical protein [Candidatus Epulonipiscium sp.]